MLEQLTINPTTILPNKNTNAIKLDDSQDNVYDPNKEGETRRINNTTGYFGTKIS